jgi:hypothetical protein
MALKNIQVAFIFNEGHAHLFRGSLDKNDK